MTDDGPKKPGATSISVPENDPAVSGYDVSKPFRNLYNVMTGRMTEEGKFAYREDAAIRNEAADCKRCEEWREYAFKYSPMVRFMSENITALNGKLDNDNVRCQRCVTRVVEEEDENGNKIKSYRRQGGGFSPDHGILICANAMRNKGHMEDTLAHEMVHAWDHLRFKVDWADLKHAACTEIRASTLSGECRWTREFFVRGHFNLTQQFQNCVRTRAVMSVMARPNCKDEEQANKVVKEVWDSCFSDTRPFDEVYR